MASQLGCPAVDPLAPTGTIDLTITGLDASATSGGTAVATPTAGGDVRTIPIPALGNKTEVVLAGEYSVQYTAPANHTLAAGQANPRIINVAADTTTAVTVALVYTAPASTGTIQITVTGLTGSPPNGGSAQCQRTDAAGSPITINVSGAGAGSSSSVPAGTYTITYTPPAGHSVTGGTTNPRTGVVVGVGATASVSFGVQATGGPRPAPLFRSDWSTATGGTDNALLDTGKAKPWTMKDNNFQDLAVVAASTLGPNNGGFPATMANVIRHAFALANPNRAAYVRIVNGFAPPAVGQTLYLRYYYRADYRDEGFSGQDNSHHNFEGDNRSGVKSVYLMHPGNYLNGTYPNRIYLGQYPDAGSSYWTPNNASQVFTKGAVYRWECAITRLDADSLGFRFRIYGADDTTLLFPDGATGYSRMIGPTGTLLSAAAADLFPSTDPTYLTSWQLGNNGSSLGPFTQECYDYFAGVCFRSDDWCGPYSTTDG